jgi:hypothetical protein
MINLKQIKNLLIGLIIVSLTNNGFAQDSIAINKGTPAPFSGILFTKQKSEQIRNELIERDQFKIFNKTLLDNSEIQQKIIGNQKLQVEILLNQNERLVKQTEKAETMSNWQRATWFGLGIISAGFAVYGASLLVR